MLSHRKNHRMKIINKIKCISLALISFSAIAQKGESFTIEGELMGLKEGQYVYLSHKWNDKIITDSAKVSLIKFKFTGTTPESNMYWIYTEPKSQNALTFFVDKGLTTIKGKMNEFMNAEVTGGPSNNAYKKYLALNKTYDDKKNALSFDYQLAQQGKDKTKMQQIESDYNALATEQLLKIDEFIVSNSNSVVAGYVILMSSQTEPKLDRMEKLYDGLSADVKKSKFGKIVADRITSVKGSTIGYPATNFTQNDAAGKPVTLSSFKGKYVLVDFWASWCGPCRGENPNVVKAYNAFKDKGFTVLGVSFDDNKEKWLKAVERDGLVWTQVSDLKGWGNEVGKLYGINSIPQNLLLDKEGKIIAKNLRGEDLYNKLEEVLK